MGRIVEVRNVSFGSFWRYALESISRNKRRTIAAIIGVLLAVTLVAGENIAIDTTASSVLSEMLESLPYDFVGHTSQNIEVIDCTNALASVQDVVRVEPFVGLGIFEITEWGYNGTENVTIAEVHAIRPSFGEVAEKFGFASDPSVPSGEIVVSEDMAILLGVNVDDQLTFRFPRQDGTEGEFIFLNMTIGKVVRMLEYQENSPVVPPGSYLRIDILINLEDVDFLLTSLGIDEPQYFETNFYVWVDRGKLVLPGDPAKTEELLVRMQRELNFVGAPYDVIFQPSNLSTMIQTFNMWLVTYRAVFIALALPAVVLGLYLGIIGAELGLGERRREIGILKARGATDRQIFTLLIIEAFILGIIAGILGILFGALTSNAFSILTPRGLRQSILELSISEFTIALAVLMAILLLLISTYRPAKRFSSLSVSQTLQRYSKEEVRVHYKPTRDLLFIGLAIFNYAGLLMLRDFTTGGTPLFAVLCFILPIVVVLTPFSPFFLVIGVTSFLTRFSTKIYDWTSHISRLITKELHDVVKKNIVRNPKRTSNVCVLIAMALAFGVIVSSISESQAAHIERVLNAEIGSDISIALWPVNASFSVELENLDDITRVATSTPLNGYLDPESRPVTVWAMNSREYLEVVHPDPYFFENQDPEAMISKLSTRGNVIVDSDLAENLHFRVGDHLILRVENQFQMPDGTWLSDQDDYSLLVVGLVKTLPGFMVSDMGLWTEGQIFADYATFANTTIGNQSHMFLVDVRSGTHPSEVKNEIVSMIPTSSFDYRIRVYEEELSEAKSDPIIGALFNFLLVEFFFSLLIIGVGLGLIMYVATVEREGEFASIMSRGASRRQVTRLLFGEAMTIIIIGVVIGVVTGLITSFVFVELISWGITAGDKGGLAMPLVVSYQTLAVVIGTILILVIATLVSCLRIGRIDLATVLRKRGG